MDPLWPPPKRTNVRGSPRPVYQDVTHQLRQAAAGLSLGQMVHPISFTLMDSMACISIADPRMDSGIDPLPEDLIPVSDRTRFEEPIPDFNPHKALSLSEVIWVMDRLLACEVAYHQAAPLAQTLYTCLYFHDLQSLDPFMAATSNAGPSSIVEVERHSRLVGLVLRAYLVATIKSIGLAWEELARGNVHEGEDTVTDTCQLSLLQEVPVGYALGQIGEAVSWLEQAQAGQSQEAKDSLEGLKLRLLLRKNILMTFALFHEATGPAADPSTNRGAFEGEVDDAVSPQIMYQQMRRLTGQIALQIGQVQLCEGHLSHAPSPLAAAAFNPSYSRRLQTAGNIPPRPVDLPPSTEVRLFWKSMAQDCFQAAGIFRIAVIGGGNTWAELSSLVESKGCLFLQRPPSPYIRSLFQSCLCPPAHPPPTLFGDFWSSLTGLPHDHLSTALDNIMETLSDCESPTLSGRGGMLDFSSNQPLGESIAWWVEKGEGLLANYLLTNMTNRPRAKRMLGKAFPRWRAWAQECQALVDRAESLAVDDANDGMDNVVMMLKALHQAVEVQTLHLAVQLVLSGFDLELYGPEEMASAYWLAHKTLGRAAEIHGRLAVGQTAASQIWLEPMLRAWQDITVLATEHGASSSRIRPRWTQSEDSQRNLFFCRFKWLQLPSRDAHGNKQDPHSELTTLWDQWREEQQSAKPLEELRQVLKQCHDLVQREGEKVRTGSTWRLCREEASLLQEQLLVSITTSTQALDAAIANQSGAASLSMALAQDDGLSRSHPWFPCLVVKS